MQDFVKTLCPNTYKNNKDWILERCTTRSGLSREDFGAENLYKRFSEK
jgi:hypothetical protein